jgi:hypothetical protein
MYDAFVKNSMKRQPSDFTLTRLDGSGEVSVPEEYYYMTCHREENTNDDESLNGILRAMNSLDAPTIYPVHPRNKQRALRLNEQYGYENVILCERGIRTYETVTRNTLDLSAVAAVKELSHLPIIVDPSHGTGRWQMVQPMARSAVAAGCDGLIIEVHPHPEVALSDGDQSLTPKNFNLLMSELGRIAEVMERTV